MGLISVLLFVVVFFNVSKPLCTNFKKIPCIEEIKWGLKLEENDIVNYL